MTKEDVILILRYPISEIVDRAMAIANLTWKEEVAIYQCGRKGRTQEQAAEDCGYSVDAMQRWFSKGIKKLIFAWSRSDWLHDLLAEIKRRENP